MAESSTEQKWLERRRHHNGLACGFLHPHEIGAIAGQPLCNEDDPTGEECERRIPLSTYPWKRDSAPTSRRRDKGSRKFENRGQLINHITLDSTLSKREK